MGESNGKDANIINTALRGDNGTKIKPIKRELELDVSAAKKRHDINKYRIKRWQNYISFAIKLSIALSFVWKILVQPIMEFAFKMCFLKNEDIIDKLINKIIGVEDWKLAFVLCATVCFIYYIRKKYSKPSILP